MERSKQAEQRIHRLVSHFSKWVLKFRRKLLPTKRKEHRRIGDLAESTSPRTKRAQRCLSHEAGKHELTFHTTFRYGESTVNDSTFHAMCSWWSVLKPLSRRAPNVVLASSAMHVVRSRISTAVSADGRTMSAVSLVFTQANLQLFRKRISKHLRPMSCNLGVTKDACRRRLCTCQSSSLYFLDAVASLTPQRPDTIQDPRIAPCRPSCSNSFNIAAEQSLPMICKELSLQERGVENVAMS